MKKLVILIVFFFITKSLVAQSWAPVGTKWTYSFTTQASWANSPFVIECVGDTIIESRFCRIFNQGFLGWGNRSYLYYENDRVYIYCNSTMKFHLLYDFSLKTGDSMQLVFPNGAGSDLDTSDLYVDSVGTLLISGETFSVQYMRNLNPYSDFRLFGGKVINKIGNISMFFPNFMNSHVYFGPLRCYQDSFRSFKFSNIPCDTNIVYASFTPDNYEDTINIYPNPVRSDLFVEFKYKDSHEFEIKVYSSIGDIVLTMNGINKRISGINNKKVTIPLERFCNGIYIIKITNTTGQTIIRKIVKQ